MKFPSVILSLIITFLFTQSLCHGPQVVGYWENWEDVDWWQNYVPGNCLMGCVQPSPFFQKTATYSSVNYGFTFLTQNPDPDKITCGNSSSECPIWDGTGIYVAHAYQNGATVVTAETTIHTVEDSPGLISIAEMCRLARQGPNGPRRCLISLGGWSDWARLDNVQNAQKLASLVAKMVLLSFADGVDLDFEHLTEFNWISPKEYDAFISFVVFLRNEFNKITPDQWNSTAGARYTDIEEEYNALPDWEKSESYYYPTNLVYLHDLQKNGPPYFEISYTTRFNAFVDLNNPWNYLLPDSPIPPPFPTRNEGAKVWSGIGKVVDNVNIMAYDGGSPAGALKFNFQTILENFKTYGPVPPEKINMGFEPGDQYAGGVWEGLDTDVATMKYIKSQKYGGAMVWAVNPSEANSAQWCPVVSQNAFTILQPVWPYGNVPVYTKCNPSTGWIP